MVESRANSFLGSLPCNENRSFIPHVIGKTVVTQAPTSSVYLSLVCESKIEWQDDTDSSKLVTL